MRCHGRTDAISVAGGGAVPIGRQVQTARAVGEAIRRRYNRRKRAMRISSFLDFVVQLRFLKKPLFLHGLWLFWRGRRVLVVAIYGWFVHVSQKHQKPLAQIGTRATFNIGVPQRIQ